MDKNKKTRIDCFYASASWELKHFRVTAQLFFSPLWQDLGNTFKLRFKKTM